jgi:chromosome partitioning protein
MAHAIAIANHKGGVGKTTTTISLGATLAEKGRDVLLVDLDPQQNLCTSLKALKPRPGLADVLTTAALLETAELSDAFVEACGMTVVGGYDLGNTETYLSYYPEAEKALHWALAPQAHRFDYILMDCGPSISFFTISALAAANTLLVPIQTEFLALNQLPAIMSTVDDVRTKLNPRLEVGGFLPTMFDGRTRHALEILEQIAVQASRYGVRGLKPIPKTIRLAEAAASGRPISGYAPDSPAAEAYEDLAAEIEGRERVDITVEQPELLSPLVDAMERPEVPVAVGYA